MNSGKQKGNLTLSSELARTQRAFPIKKMMVNPSDQYFLVQAVKLAIKHRAQLPAEWYLLAIERWEQMKVETPFGDESVLLPKAIAAWRAAWDIPNSDPKNSFVVRMQSKFL